MFSLPSETLSLCSNKGLVGLFPSYKNTASTWGWEGGREPPTRSLQGRPASTGNHTTAISHWNWEVGPSKPKRTSLHKANPQPIGRSHCSFGDPLPPHPNLTKKPRPTESKGPVQTHPQEVTIVNTWLCFTFKHFSVYVCFHDRDHFTIHTLFCNLLFPLKNISGTSFQVLVNLQSTSILVIFFILW